MRIISLLPSATELLCAIEGGAAQLVGRSHECDFPQSIAHLPALTSQRITAATSAAIDAQVRAVLAREHDDGDDVKDDDDDASPNASLYTLDANLFRALQPDLILTQDLCDVCSINLRTVRAVARIMHPEPRVLSLNPATIEDVFDDLLRVGEAAHLQREAEAALVALRERYWSLLDYCNACIEGPEVAFLEWMDPLFTAGHWTPQLIIHAGARHSLNEGGAKSRRITPDELVAALPQRLIICPCGYGLEQIKRELPHLIAQPWWRELPAVRDGNVALVDGSQMFNRPGPRLVDATEWLVSWLHDRPELLPANFPVEASAPGIRR